MDDKLPFSAADVAELARPRYGNGNPEFTRNACWEYMVRQRRTAYWARQVFRTSGGSGCDSHTATVVGEHLWLIGPPEWRDFGPLPGVSHA